MGLYYLIPQISAFLIGAAFVMFFTTMMKNKYASLPRAAMFSFSRILWLYLISSLLGFYEYWIVLLYAGYYFIFLKIYHTSYLAALRFLFFSTVFGISMRILVSPGLQDTLAEYIY
ncbi:MAG TPA: hypothetical protein VJH23_06515 [archaeon]|nr:hypothetical protein [archaeon]